MKPAEILFVLDIGTRSVIGVAGRMKDGLLEVLHVESMEHSARAVVDGQIQDIEQTARVARQVKERLEQALGVELDQVYVAAAGRVLKTERTLWEMELDESRPVGAREVLALESAAMEKAYRQLQDGLAEGEFADFCNVGHSVVGWKLDGYEFSTLIGHRGRTAQVEMITTFLPSEVVESLYTAMSMLGLTIAGMTLEPIAAMNAVVPRELRLLNVALVDVGAGTSDIAVADKGGVCGYTMVTTAGDEITEGIMQAYLVDFATAEKMKLALSSGAESIAYEDILGFSCTVSAGELEEKIAPCVKDLAERISQGILEINGAPPRAVFLVGGGSRTPGLCAQVSKTLGVEENRVAVGGSNFMKRQIIADDSCLGPEFATPMGIALTAMNEMGGEGFSVLLNGTRLQLLGKGMTVMEALRRSGYQYSQIMGRSGKSVVFEYNGQRRVVRGGLPTLAEIRVNDALAGLSTLVQAGDEIVFVPAADGADASPRIQDAADNWKTFPVDCLGRRVLAGSRAWRNGEPAQGDEFIRREDRIAVCTLSTVGELLEAEGEAFLPGKLLLNGSPCADPGQPLKEGDRLSLAGEPAQAPAAATAPQGKGVAITLNGSPLRLPPAAGGKGYQFFDLFNYVDIDPRNPQGEIVLRRNGAVASYLEPIQEGDHIEIHWSGGGTQS